MEGPLTQEGSAALVRAVGPRDQRGPGRSSSRRTTSAYRSGGAGSRTAPATSRPTAACVGQSQCRPSGLPAPAACIRATTSTSSATATSCAARPAAARRHGRGVRGRRRVLRAAPGRRGQHHHGQPGTEVPHALDHPGQVAVGRRLRQRAPPSARGPHDRGVHAPVGAARRPPHRCRTQRRDALAPPGGQRRRQRVHAARPRAPARPRAAPGPTTRPGRGSPPTTRRGRSTPAVPPGRPPAAPRSAVSAVAATHGQVRGSRAPTASTGPWNASESPITRSRTRPR